MQDYWYILLPIEVLGEEEEEGRERLAVGPLKITAPWMPRSIERGVRLDAQQIESKRIWPI